MILLVDDNKSVVDTYTQLLKHAGFKVSAHSCPKQALNTFSQKPQAFDAILTDHAMPNMTGLDLIASAKNINPNIKSILYTGMAPSPVPEHVTVLQKPSTFKQVLSVLTE